MRIASVTISIFLALLAVGNAAPVTFEEVSLLVRIQERPEFIAREVTTRRLLRPLTEQQEATLRSQGATSGIMELLRRPASLLSEKELAAWEQLQLQWKLAREGKTKKVTTASTQTRLPVQTQAPVHAPLPAEPGLGAFPP